MHQRQKIREAIYNALYESDLLRELFDNKGRATPISNSPFSNVTIGKEIAEERIDGYGQKRTLPIFINVYIQAGIKSPDKLDDIAESIEGLLSQSYSLDGAVENIEYKGADPDYKSGAEQGIAALTLEYECTYTWEPVLSLEDLKTVFIEIDMASPRNDPQVPAEPDGQIDATVLIENLDQ